MWAVNQPLTPLPLSGQVPVFCTSPLPPSPSPPLLSHRPLCLLPVPCMMPSHFIPYLLLSLPLSSSCFFFPPNASGPRVVWDLKRKYTTRRAAWEGRQPRSLFPCEPNALEKQQVQKVGRRLMGVLRVIELKVLTLVSVLLVSREPLELGQSSMLGGYRVRPRARGGGVLFFYRSQFLLFPPFSPFCAGVLSAWVFLGARSVCRSP